MSPKRNPFDGWAARPVAKLMARGNRDAEAEAVELLDPKPGDSVVAVGIGPGVGVSLLAERLTAGQVVGVDPSAVMLEEAKARCGHLEQVELVRTSADDLPVDDATIDGVIAVNSIQLWEPFEASIAEVARVLRPGGRLVTLTHDWAIERSTTRSVEDWVQWATQVCSDHDLIETASWRARAENGRSVAFIARKRMPAPLQRASGGR